MAAEGQPVRLGLLRLTDAAPVFLAEAMGLFAAEGIEVRLSVEPSWANIADKLAFGLLDAAVMLPPLALAMELGLREPAAPLLVPMALSLNGNAVVLERRLAEAVLAPDGGPDPLAAGRRLAAALRTLPRPPRLAVVHAFSTHDLLLRYWLAASGIDPGRAVELVVVPPAATTAALASGRIEGFCAGAPWNAVAEQAGVGRTVLRSAEIWHDHPEKCLAVRAAWAEQAPTALQALLRALLRAGLACDEPARAPALAELLAAPERLDLPPALILPSLPGAEDAGRSRFATHAASFPWRSHARWFADQLARWHDLPADTAARTERLYRPELYAEAARALSLAVPQADRKEEGGQAADWLLPATPAPIAMGPDSFCDGQRFPA